MAVSLTKGQKVNLSKAVEKLANVTVGLGCEYCYDLKHLDINGHDLKNIGIPDVEISHYLNGLLQLVIAGAVENNNEKLIEVARISRF